MVTSFAELGLNEHILAGVDALGFATPTPVQAEAIPAVLAGRDVVASAQTGTGKTAAFALPVLQVIAPASRAAREEIAAGPDTPADAEGPQVLADAVPEDSFSVPAGTPDAPAPRRRRRHHKRRSATQADAGGEVAAEADAAPHKDGAPTPKADGDQVAGKGKRRRRGRRQKPAKRADGVSNDTGTTTETKGAAADGDGDTKSAAKAKPKRRRNRRKKKPASSTPTRDSREKNPDAQPFGPFALVVTPTRELAQQIDRVVSVVCEHTGQRAVIVMGGTKFDRQIRELERGCDLLVATPGRLIDLMEHDHVDLSHIQVLVLDEADRMLDMGFWPSVRRIVAALPQERQNLLFSATIPDSIKSTIDNMLTDPVHVEIARTGETAETVEEHLCCVTQGQKVQLLSDIIRGGGAEPGAELERVLVFCRTKQRVDDISGTLKRQGFSVDEMHSDRPQKVRERALAKFRAGKCQVLVATDVMSRGIDVSGIDAVVNFDVPLDPEDYVHRVGRTGRAGATGHAYTFVAPDEVSPLREIEYFTGKLVPTWDLPGFAYDDGRIVPSPTRGTVKPTRTMFSGSRSRGRGLSAGRYGRHY